MIFFENLLNNKLTHQVFKHNSITKHVYLIKQTHT